MLIFLIPLFLAIAAFFAWRTGSRGGSLVIAAASLVWVYVVIFHFHSLTGH